MNKILVITSITNDKDKLLDPPKKFEGCDYVAFVDKIVDDVEIWEQKLIYNFSFIDKYKDRRNAKIYKLLSSLMFPQYDYIIWEDGNHQLKMDPQKIFEEYGNDFDLLLFKHPDRVCTYQEMNAVAQWKLDELPNIQNQFNFYKGVGMPEKWGLFEMSTFIIKNTPIINTFQLMWYEQICKFTSRDQISLPFVLWKLGNKINFKILKGYSNLFSMDGQNTGNEYFEDQGKHLKY
jgi:hypothetical protein